MTRIRLLGTLLIIAGSLGAGRDTAVFPTGTTLPIRFLEQLKSGQDAVGARVLVQTLGPLVEGACVVVPAYTRAVGRVTLSRGGRLFGGRGALALRFDSLQAGPGEWVGFQAVLATLEYTPGKDVTRTGVVYGGRASMPKRAAVVGIMGVADIADPAVAMLGGLLMARRGPAARILAGEVGSLRLTAPLRVSHEGPCATARPPHGPAALPEMPPFVPRSEAKGRIPGDPINFIFLASAEQLDSAFRHAGWVGPVQGTVGTVTREIVLGLENRQAIGAPLSTQYFQGRRQDLAFELAGPTARSRHHVRIWLLDSVAGVWVGAANQDVGMMINPFIGRFTHAIRPEIDGERDRIAQELEATGCADLLDNVPLPGAVTEGRNATGQRFVTDGRAAVVRLRPCGTVPGALADAPVDLD